MAWLPAGLVQTAEYFAPVSTETFANSEKFVHRRSPSTDREAARRARTPGTVCAMRLILLVLAVLLATAAPAAAHPNPNGLPLNFGGPGEKITANAAQAPQPAPVPRPDCRPTDRKETDIQGRVPAGNPEGFNCNTDLVGHHGSSGGYKALRFTDKAGRECAYYDTTLLFPTNAQTLSERPTGVAVLDMSDPRTRSRRRSRSRPRCRPRTSRCS